jgi:hypothetical protein
MWGGALLAMAIGGCAHEQAESAQPMAENEMNQSATQNQSATAAQTESSYRQPVAGHESTEGAVLKPQGTYNVKQGEYKSEQGEYFQPQGIYGTKGRLETKGEVISQGEFGTYTKPKCTLQRPTALNVQPEGTFYRPFGSNQMSERQPVAGHEEGYLFVRGASGKTWQVSDPGVIRQVEQKLSDQGCNPGAIDGKADEQFSKALMQCQQKMGVQATGVIDQATASALGIDFASLSTHHRMTK